MAVAEGKQREQVAARQAAAGVADVRIEAVTKRFDDVVAVDGLTLAIEPGSFFALLGPSGCGKTTTLRMLGGFERPDEGRILLRDRDVTDLPPYRRNVNTVFQSYALFPHLSVGDNVAFGLRRQGIRGNTVRARVREILEIVRLGGLEKRKPRQLSGGQQQRVALARALVVKPQVLLLDEPLGALDLKLRKEMQLELKAIQRDVGITFVHVTHDQEEAMTMADAIAVMNEGRIEQLGPPRELYERPTTAFVAGFLGVSNLLHGLADGAGNVRLHGGTYLKVADRRAGQVAVGIRPEQITLDDEGGSGVPGRVKQCAYIGVATEYVVETNEGELIVYAQGPPAVGPGAGVRLAWDPAATFVVEREEE